MAKLLARMPDVHNVSVGPGFKSWSHTLGGFFAKQSTMRIQEEILHLRASNKVTHKNMEKMQKNK
jgi:hypothetical protein